VNSRRSRSRANCPAVGNHAQCANGAAQIVERRLAKGNHNQPEAPPERAACRFQRFALLGRQRFLGGIGQHPMHAHRRPTGRLQGADAQVYRQGAEPGPVKPRRVETIARERTEFDGIVIQTEDQLHVRTPAATVPPEIDGNPAARRHEHAGREFILRPAPPVERLARQRGRHAVRHGIARWRRPPPALQQVAVRLREAGIGEHTVGS
jgi:hypothetical protein